MNDNRPYSEISKGNVVVIRGPLKHKQTKKRKENPTFYFNKLQQTVLTVLKGWLNNMLPGFSNGDLGIASWTVIYVKGVRSHRVGTGRTRLMAEMFPML